MRTQGRFWPTNVFRRPVMVTGPDMRAAGVVRAIEQIVNRGMQGLTGTVLRGNTADPVYRWNGYTNYLTVAETATVGASRNLRGTPNVALPATGGQVIITQSTPGDAVRTTLAALPPGTR